MSATLAALVTQGKARILAEPKLVAASGKEATSLLGVEVPIITATSVSSGTVTQNIEFRDTGVELKFRPTVLENQRSIQLVIDAKVSSIDTTNAITVSGIRVPGFRVRETTTEIVTDSGQAVFIAGLLQDEEKKNISQIPAVGSIPVLGNLFRSTEFIRGQTELIIIVTPDLDLDRTPSAERTLALEQALAYPEVPGAYEETVRRYALKVHDRISQSLRYPIVEGWPRTSGQVKLRLHLARDGTLLRAVVAEPSGIEAFDREALQATESQSPFPPFPVNLPQQDLWLELPVIFRL
jgi:TonB family protein